VHKHVLANVNGFYHYTDVSERGVFVVDGMKSCLLSGRNELGLLSFLKLGEIKLIPIEPHMVYKHKSQQKLRYNCFVDAGQDLSQKTVMLVLGGYLHVLDPHNFWRISGSCFGINFDNIPLVDRYYESHKVIDLSSLVLDTTENNPSQINIEQLFSDEVLVRYLSLSQSFFVVLDNQDVFVETLPVKTSPYPGCYTSFGPPIYPLVIGRGRHEVFWPRKEHDRYSLSVNATWTGKFNYDTVRVNKQQSVSDARIPVEGFRNWDAHFLLIGSDI
jgi:hypothetical protein